MWAGRFYAFDPDVHDRDIGRVTVEPGGGDAVVVGLPRFGEPILARGFGMQELEATPIWRRSAADASSSLTRRGREEGILQSGVSAGGEGGDHGRSAGNIASRLDIAWNLLPRELCWAASRDP